MFAHRFIYIVLLFSGRIAYVLFLPDAAAERL